MRVLRLTALALCLCLCVCGCSRTGEVENQAYALVMGVDRAADGGIALTIRIPRIGQTQGEGEGSGGESDPYRTVSAAGGDYAQALERLQWAVARELNLSQLKLVIVSEALAASEDFKPLISRIAETRHLYTTAGFVVCEGQARSFIEGQSIQLGTRLSSEINAMFRHYADHGVIPRATLAELYYDTRSGCADPTAIWGVQESEAAPAGAVIGPDIGQAAGSISSGDSRHYLGAAVFHDGRMACRLDAAETLCLNLLTGRVKAFMWRFGGRTWSLSSLTAPRRRASLGADGARAEAVVTLTAEERVPPEQVQALEDDVAGSLLRLIHRCQALGVEPFGFSLRAAAGFLTQDEWWASGWCERFSGAEVAVTVRLVNAPA